MSDVPFEAPSIESIAELFPAFDFDHLIAQGGMGAVYKATQRSLDRDVAIKILPRELGEDPMFRTSFEAEAKAMARVVHPNLIGVFDSGEVDGLLFIVMEYVPGKSLFHSAHQKSVDPQQAVELVMGICSGLAEAHEHSIVHRDIKPANILLTQKRVPKIGDFGLARAAGHDSGGLAMGTPGYAAPEVIEQPELADQRSDLFAVGVILRELITGRPPENDPNPEEGITDSGLLKICRKATDPDPSLRYQDGESMIADLKSWLRPEAKPSPSNSVDSAPAPPTVIDNSASSSLGRNVAFIVVLLAAIFGAWKMLQNKKAANEALAQKSTKTKVTSPAPKKVAPPQTSRPEPIAPQAPKAPTPPAVVDIPPSETPAQSLLRLRGDLSEGDFTELPIGTLTKGDSYYFFVSKDMTWRQASRMARAYGGHLPLVDDEPTRQWLAESIPTGDTTWIGATRTSPEQWQLVSASPWKLGSPPKGDGEFAAIHRDGSAQAGGNSKSHPFFIQWHRDGPNPTHIEEILKLCEKSQQSDQPFFPPGIEAHGDRRFLIVEQPVDCDEARETAQLGGGKLMSAATEEEADWLEKRVESVTAPGGLWLGATLQDDYWAWTSNQAWTFARWNPSSQPNSGDALLVFPKSGWAPADRSTEASGFIIEWSDDQQTDKPTTDDGLGGLVTKAKGLLAGLDAKRNKAAAKNADEYIWKLDVWLKRRRNKTEITHWTPFVLAIKSTVKDGRLPVDIPRNPNALYQKPLHEIAQFHFNKQEAIDLGFTTEAEKIRDAYVSRLSEARNSTEKSGQRERAMMISEEISTSSDIDAWIRSFAGIASKSRPTVGVTSATYGSRGNNADVTERVKQFIETDQTSFRVLAKNFGVDPDPGWNKGIRLEFTVDGQAYTKQFGRNSLVSPEVLIKHAELNSGAAPEE